MRFNLDVSLHGAAIAASPCRLNLFAD